MNYYFLLEDEKSFIKILPKWLLYMRALKKSDSLKKNWAFFSVGIIIEV